MNILFYYPFNKRTIPIDVPLFALKEKGHSIFLLTMQEKGSLHELYEAEGIFANAHNKETRFGQLLELIRFCKKNRIDVIHSHLQQANLVAVIGSKFMSKTRVVPFRHHCKFHHLISDPNLKPPAKEVIADKIINLLSADKIIVPSTGVRNTMVKEENVKADKIKVVPYIYHFEQMRMVNNKEVEAIKKQFGGKVRIIMVSRMTPYKRHLVAFQAFRSLLLEGKDIQVLVMDEGPEMGSLKDFVKENSLEQHIHFLGFRTNILSYIAASDVIVHPSLTDASNSAVKEAGLFEKVAVVCDQVGDFNDYIKHGENGFLVNPEKFQSECIEVITQLLKEPSVIRNLGKNLKMAILNRFSYSEEVVDLYQKL